MHLCPRQCHYESERCVTLRELWQQGERAQLRMKNGRETMGLVVKFFTYFRALSLSQTIHSRPKSHEPMLYTFNYDSIFLLWLVLQLWDGVGSGAQASPRHISVLVPLLPEKCHWRGWGMFSVHSFARSHKSWLVLKRVQQRDGWDTWNATQVSLAKLALSCF